MNPLHHSPAGPALLPGFGILLLALAGCAALPARAPASSVAVPGAWATAEDTGTATTLAPALWWAQFDDPLLSTLAARAAQANTRIQTAEANLRQARALRDGQSAALGPALDATASAQRARSNGANGNSFQAGLGLGWAPFADRHGLAAAEATVRERAATLGDVQVAIAAEVGLAYIDLRDAQARLIIAQRNLDSQQETLQITRWRNQAGLVTDLEAEQARTAVAQTRALLPALQTRIDQDAHALAVLTAQPPGTWVAALTPVAPLPQARSGLALSLPAETLRQRADVQAAERAVSAAWALVAQADAARRPTFNLSGSLGVGAATLGGLSSGGAVAAAVLAAVSMPLYDGGAVQAQVRAQQAAYDSARIAYQATVLAALQGVEDALVALRDDRARLVQLEDAADAAANAAQLARQRYSSGLVDFQTVLETQRTQLSTQDGVASARAAVSADHVRLFRALGGGWQPDAAPIETFLRATQP